MKGAVHIKLQLKLLLLTVPNAFPVHIQSKPSKRLKSYNTVVPELPVVVCE